MISSPAKALVTSRNKKSQIACAALATLGVALWWQPILSTVRLALSSDAHTHILLIIPLSIALIYLERHQMAVIDPSGIGSGLALLAAAGFLRLFTTWHELSSSASVKLAVSMLALVIWWIGSVVACFGLRILRSHLFPLFFLLLLVPVPNTVVTAATEALQDSSAISTEILFQMARVPVMRHGVALSIPGLDIEVSKECSSIRSSTMLIVITLIFAHLFLRSGWRKTLLVLMAVPLSVAKNAVRIFTIAELATRVDPAYLDGKLHHHGGVIFLGLAVMVTVVLLWILRKGDLRTVRGRCNPLQPKISLQT